MGDTVANAQAIAVMNEMAIRGGTSRAFFASDSASLDIAISTAVRHAIDRDGAAAAVAVANANVTAETSAFQAGYNAGNWSGDLQTTTGTQHRLHRRAASVGSHGAATTRRPGQRQPKDCQLQRHRRGRPGILFRPHPLPPDAAPAALTTLSLSQQNSISAANGPAIVKYIRGDRSGEGTTYRQRAHVLGDVCPL